MQQTHNFLPSTPLSILAISWSNPCVMGSSSVLVPFINLTLMTSSVIPSRWCGCHHQRSPWFLSPSPRLQYGKHPSIHRRSHNPLTTSLTCNQQRYSSPTNWRWQFASYQYRQRFLANCLPHQRYSHSSSIIYLLKYQANSSKS